MNSGLNTKDDEMVIGLKSQEGIAEDGILPSNKGGVCTWLGWNCGWWGHGTGALSQYYDYYYTVLCPCSFSVIEWRIPARTGVPLGKLGINCYYDDRVDLEPLDSN